MFGGGLNNQFTCYANISRTADSNLLTQAMHCPAAICWKLVAEFQIVDQQFTRWQLMELAI